MGGQSLKSSVGKRQKNIGLEMVKKGYAQIYDEYAYQCDEDQLTKFENRARKRGKGHWAYSLISVFKEEVVAESPSDTTVKEPVVQEPMVQEPVVQEPVVQEPVVQESVVV